MNAGEHNRSGGTTHFELVRANTKAATVLVNESDLALEHVTEVGSYRLSSRQSAWAAGNTGDDFVIRALIPRVYADHSGPFW